MQSNTDNIKLRWDLITQAIEESQFAAPGNDFNEIYNGRLKYIQENEQLTEAEKEEANENITFHKNYINLIRLKVPTYRCKKCNQQSLTISSCEHCVRNILKAQFNNWTSEIDSIDKAIQECQLNCPLP